MKIYEYLKSRPDLIAEWSIKNNIITDNITLGSGKKVWWQCPVAADHVWQATVFSRSIRNTNCPFCVGSKVAKSTCLATLDPKTASMWFYSKNGLLTPSQVTKSSNRKVWWQCPVAADHAWQAKICTVTYAAGTGCPFCSGLRASSSNCLEFTHPELAAEWDYISNSPITPKNVTFGSSKAYYWLCHNGHSWKARICNRTAKISSECVFCNQSAGESAISRYLLTHSIEFQPEFRVPSIKARFDFIINLGLKRFLVEYHGHHHYMPVPFGSRNPIKILNKHYETIKNDKRKKEWCDSQQIPLLIIPYWDQSRITSLLHDFITEKCVKTSDMPTVISNRIASQFKRFS